MISITHHTYSLKIIGQIWRWLGKRSVTIPIGIPIPILVFQYQSRQKNANFYIFKAGCALRACIIRYFRSVFNNFLGEKSKLLKKLVLEYQILVLEYQKSFGIGTDRSRKNRFRFLRVNSDKFTFNIVARRLAPRKVRGRTIWRRFSFANPYKNEMFFYDAIGQSRDRLFFWVNHRLAIFFLFWKLWFLAHRKSVFDPSWSKHLRIRSVCVNVC